MKTTNNKMSSVLTVLIALGALFLNIPVLAQGAAGYSEYYIPGNEGTSAAGVDSKQLGLWYILDDLDNSTTTNMHSVIAVTAWTPNTTVYYDHWEDGLDFDPNNPATADETVTLATAGAQNFFESNNFTIPRSTQAACNTSTTCVYDGGDRLYVAGGVVTVTRSGWIQSVGAGNQSVAWEIYPVKPQLTTYILPFGEDLGVVDFNRVYVLIQATANGTTFQVDLDGDGSYDLINANRNANKNSTDDSTIVSLNAGQTFLLDRISACRVNTTACTTVAWPGTAPGTLNTGTLIQGNNTLQVKFVAGNPGQSYAARGFSAFPRGYWTKEYYAPLDESASAQNNDYYLHNPHATALTVNWQSRTSSGSFSIPAKSTVSYRAVPGGGAPLEDSGLYFSAADVFWGVGSNDAGANVHEWGFSLLPATFLYDEHYLGWAPGFGAGGVTSNWDDDGIFLIPAQDNTRVFVDYDNNGVVDQTYTLNRLQTQFIYDTTDGNMSGAHIWATGKFTMAYGENSDTAGTSNPSLDLGYVCIPGTDFISLVLNATKTVKDQVVSTASGTEDEFTLVARTEQYPVSNLQIVDTLPPNWEFVPNSTTITRPDLSVVSGASYSPTITGSGTALDPYVLTWSAALLGTSNMAANQQVKVVFKARTTAVLAAGTLSRNRMAATATRTIGGATQTFTATDFAYVASGNLTIAKTSSATGPLYPGDTFSYTVTVSNPAGSPTQTGVTLYDPIPQGLSYVAGSGQVTCQRASQNVRDEFATAAYNNNGPNNTANWATNWSETDSVGGGATGGFVWVTDGQLQLRDLFQVPANALYADSFSSASYSLNSGTSNWASSWVEVGDDVSGLPSAGTIGIDGDQRLEFRAGTGLGESISRSANVLNYGDLRFSYYFQRSNDLPTGEQVIAEYSANATDWTPIRTFSGSTADDTTFADIVPWNPSNGTVYLRFRSLTALTREIRFDDVGIFVDSSSSTCSVQRTANINTWTSPQLSFTYGSSGLQAADSVLLEVSTNGTAWTTLSTFTGGIASTPPPYDLTSYRSTTTFVRFRVTGGFDATSKKFSVDNVDISALGTASSFASGSPPSFLVASTGCGISPGGTLGLTFNVKVDNPFPSISPSLTNTAATTSTQFPNQITASVTNTVTIPVAASASIAGRVWFDADSGGDQDIGEPGIANVSVTLKDQFGTPIATTTTDGNGRYLFTGATPGNGYYVEVAAGLPSGVTQSFPCPPAASCPANPRTDNRTNSFNLTAGQNYSGADLGYKPNPSTVAFGDLVWVDSNSNGIREAGEAGLGGVTVTLYRDANNDGLLNDTAIATTTSDADGSYLFAGITPAAAPNNRYFVVATTPSGFTPTNPTQRTFTSVTSPNSYLIADFGFSGTTFTFKDRVWLDANGDGNFSSENGIGGVTVDILDASLNVIGTTTTASDGTFTFSGLPGSGADYTVRITDTAGVLTGFAPTTTYATARQRLEDNLTANRDRSAAPSYGFRTTRSIGDTVFYDAGGVTGVQDAGEGGIQGVPVSLYRDINGDGIINLTASPGGSVSTTLGSATVTGTTTSFLNYHAGEPIIINGVVYTIATVASATSLTLTTNATAAYSGTAYSAPSVGLGLVSTTSGSPTVTGNASTSFLSYRAGEPITINGVVYTIASIASNSSLTLTTNATASNSNVAYYGPGDALLGQVTTDASGQYLFSGLPDRNYIVSVPPQTGYTFQVPASNPRGFDSDSGMPGIQGRATISGSPNVLDLDYGFRATNQRSVSGTLWVDTDKDGIIDTGETRLQDVTVEVYLDSDNDGVLDSGEPRIATQRTDSNGDYAFSGLASGRYIVRVTDADGKLTNSTAVYERTELLTGPFNYLEAVNLTSSSLTGINFGYGPLAPTYVSIASVGAFLSGGSVFVEWVTTQESGTLGFHLLRWSQKTSSWVRVNETLLSGLLVHPQGGSYRFRDPGAVPQQALTYKIVEVETNGTEKEYGPYTVVAASSGTIEGSYQKTPAEISSSERVRLDAMEKEKTSASAVSRQGAAVKLLTRGAGLYAIDARTISGTLGMAEESVKNAILGGHLLLENGGTAVSYSPAADGSHLRFYAEAIVSPYTLENSYRLSWQSGRKMRSFSNLGVPRSKETGFTETLRLEQDYWALLAFATDPEADFWAWDYLSAGVVGQDRKNFTIKTPGAAGTGMAQFTVRLFGGSNTVVPLEHDVRISWNGIESAKARWDGREAYEVQFDIPASRLIAGDNTLTLTAVLNAGVPYSVVYFDSLDVSYERRYEAAGDELTFTANAGAEVLVSGFTTPSIQLFDITDPSDPMVLPGGRVVADGRTYGMQFVAPGVKETRRFLALGMNVSKTPVRAVAESEFRLASPDNASDYLLIAPRSLMEAAERLATYRSRRGQQAMAVCLDEIYDEFNYGVESPLAIRDFLGYAASVWRRSPRFVTLIGRGTYDYKNYRGVGDNIMPALFVGTPHGLMVSDGRFAESAARLGSTISIGRLPVLTSTELLDYIEKMELHESSYGSWQSSLLLTADNPDGSLRFPDGSESVGALVPFGHQVQKVYLTSFTPASGRDAILKALNSGVLLFNYVGHGAPNQLASEGLLLTSDVPSLQNAGRLNLFLPATCSATNFSVPGFPSLGEALVLSPSGGSFAAWGPAGLSDNATAIHINQNFYNNYYRESKKTLGDLCHDSLEGLALDSGREYMVDIYNLIGEPVSQLP